MVLSSVTLIASVAYYRYIRKAQFEYEKAKASVGDIVLSFNRELKRERDKIELLAFKIEGNSAKVDLAHKKIEGYEKRIIPLEGQMNAVSQIKAGITNNVTTLLSGLTGLESKLKDIESGQEALKVTVRGFEEEIRKLTIVPAEIRHEAAIPFKRDKAIGALTTTELVVLEFLSTEGSKTAPEIREKVNLSREHTARLMKKLFEEGYLEREAGKVHFRYSIKEEMQRIMKKPENGL